MVNNHLESGSRSRVLGKHVPNEIEQVLAHLDLALEHGLLGILHEAFVPLVSSLMEWLLCSDEHEEHHSAGEDIDSRAFVLATLGSEKLGSHVVEGAASGLEEVICSFHQAKISDFGGHRRVQETIFQLHISVSQFLLMNVAQATDNLSENLPGQRLLQTASILDEVEELTLLAQLSNDEESFTHRLVFHYEFISSCSEHPEHIRVFQVLRTCLKLDLERLVSLGPGIFEHLDTHSVSSLLVAGEVASTKLAVSEHFVNLEDIDLVGVGRDHLLVCNFF